MLFAILYVFSRLIFCFGRLDAFICGGNSINVVIYSFFDRVIYKI